ncbi:hypothetical protein [Macrococcus capreoli]|uniref:hypothetical protein n=1 Tax=Macrococcus capreoli TaxID=2982690 RepID=UPI003EE56AC7
MKPNDTIVDTDIWVFLVLSNFYNRVIQYHGKLYFSDVVEREIMKWQTNIGHSKKIAQRFEELKRKKQIVVISIEEFSKLERLSIDHQLSEYGLKSVQFAEKNKGEFVSFIYAMYKGIHKMKTNDRKFATEIKHSAYVIDIEHWDALLDLHAHSLKEKQDAMNKIKSLEAKMKKEHPSNVDPRWEKLKGFV